MIITVKKFFIKSCGFLKLSSLTGKIGFSRQLVFDQEHHLPKGCKIINHNSPLLKSNDFSILDGEKFRCLIFPTEIPIPQSLVKEAKKKRIAIFRSDLSTHHLRKKFREVSLLFQEKKSVIPGGLIKVYDYGVLIQGDSGIGKSESALELVARGHKFISDDVTLVEKTVEGKLIGKAPSMSKFFMEIRGLGIINIEKIFGSQAVLDRYRIDLVINLKRWDEGATYDRLGLSFPEECRLLNVCIPQISIPVAPGRNMATLIEVATKVHQCRLDGYIAAEDIIERLNQALTRGNNEPIEKKQ